ncbi:MAG TPA: alkaline phosphatase [Gammaproteobacteria bacterium]
MITNRFCMLLLSAAILVACTPGSLQSYAVKQHDDPWYVQGQAQLARAQQQRPITRRARNVIIFLGDGMGISTQTAARIFEGQSRGESGEENFLSFERFPYLALSKTYNTNQQVPDSAGTATAIMTGIKTKAGIIDISDQSLVADCASSKGHEVQSLIELGELAGLSTGVVTTTRLTHATPATVYAHSPDRDWGNDTNIPAAQKALGCKDIAQQLLTFPGNGLEVAMGGGRRDFIPDNIPDPEDKGKTGQRRDGRHLVQEWLERYNNAAYVWNKAQFDAIDPATTDHLLGLFDISHMEYARDRANDIGGEPSLPEMTRKAIQILARNPQGFVLLVEGGRIDHAHHDANAYRSLVETVEFSAAVQAAVELTDVNETLIIVTADHSHTLSIGGFPVRGNPILGKVVDNDVHGLPEQRISVDVQGLPYTTLNYANGPGAWDGKSARRPDLTHVDTAHPDYIQQGVYPFVHPEYGEVQTHGGEDVAIMARGPYAHLFGGVVEQNYIFHVVDYALGLGRRIAR